MGMRLLASDINGSINYYLICGFNTGSSISNSIIIEVISDCVYKICIFQNKYKGCLYRERSEYEKHLKNQFNIACKATTLTFKACLD